MRWRAFCRPTSSFTTRSWIAVCWRSRARRRGSNLRANAGGPPRPGRGAPPNPALSAGPQARLEFAGKRGGRPSAEQRDISTRLIELARAGHRVLRLKGGDPCVFGRGGEEALALRAAGVPFRIIPGVTAGLAGLTAAAIPATFRGMNRALILAAGYGADDAGLDWTALARTGQPIVLYTAMRNLAAIADQLMRGGLPPSTPAAVVVSATTADERVVVSTLEGVAADAQDLATPAIIVIGEIVQLRARLMESVRLAEGEAA